MIDAGEIDWKKGGGLAPAIVQDALTRQVLMLGYMNRDAYKATIKTGKVTFFSRSRNALWVKGETSGNVLELVDMTVDCDKDAILVEATPAGPTCHLGLVSCFGDDPGPGLGFLGHLERIIESRKDKKSEKSYVAKLFAKAPKKPAQKVGEEGVEVALAAVSEDDEALAGEAADLIFHLIVLLQSRGMTLADTLAVLRERHAERAAS